MNLSPVIKSKQLLRFCLLAYFLDGNVIWTIACDVCKKNQPKGFENVTHGSGPQGNIDYIITWTAVIIVTVALVFSIKYLVKPNESNPDHVKHSIVE